MWRSRFQLLAWCSLMHIQLASAQVDSMYSSTRTEDGTAFAVILDSVVVSDFKRGVDIPFFIKKTQTDESLYKAFKLFRYRNCDLAYQLSFKDKSAHEIAQSQGLNRQIYQDRCRTMKIMRNSFRGKLFDRKGEYRFYTMKLFERLFFTKEKVCETPPEQISLTSDTDRHVNELKKLIFKPGTKADVPFIGHKMAIFTKSMAQYYDFRLISTSIGGIDCYSFVVTVKPDIERKKKDATVVKFLETYFDKSNYQIVGRKYNLVYHGFWFDFDVIFDIELTNQSGSYLPKAIRYEGYWDVPMTTAERGSFAISFDYW